MLVAVKTRVVNGGKPNRSKEVERKKRQMGHCVYEKMIVGSIRKITPSHRVLYNTIEIYIELYFALWGPSTYAPPMIVI